MSRGSLPGPGQFASACRGIRSPWDAAYYEVCMPVHVVHRNGRRVETYASGKKIDVVPRGVTTYRILDENSQVLALVPAELVHSIHTEEPQAKKE